MASLRTTRALIMMVAGLALIATAVGVALATAEPLPVALGVVGLVFVGVGARQRRKATK